jgi:hypothetical protein
MAYTTIKKPSDYFNTKLYTGNGYPTSNSNNITGVGFQPDLVWLKVRSNADNHCWFDSVRGVQKRLASNLTAVESNRATALTSFDSDGFTLGTNSESNTENYTYASWNWLASNTTTSNTDGSITSTVSANTTSGFSIVSYTGTGSPGTVGHGLGTTPSMIIVKDRTTAGEYWHVYHKSLGATKSIYLNVTDAAVTTNGSWNNTEPTSTVFSIGTVIDTSSANLIAYCFAEKQGFSKFGSYNGNGNADGTFIYTGFKPSFIMIKSSSLSSDWNIWDNKRPDYNVVNRSLEPHQSDAETVSAGRDIDILSNGFKARGTSSSMNSSGASYIYMAFAEEPLVGDNPATAR